MATPEEQSILIEQYLKSQDREAFLKTLVKGSNFHQSLTVQHILNERQHNFTQQQEEILKIVMNREYKFKDRTGAYTHHFELMKLLYELTDQKTTEQRKEQIIYRLREGYFNIDCNHHQPSDVTNKNLTKQAVPLPVKIQGEVLDYKQHLKKAAVDYNELRLINNESILGEIDTAKLLTTPNVQSLEWFVRTADIHGLGDVAVEFIKEIVQRRTTDQYKHPVDSQFYQRLTIHQLETLANQLSDVTNDQNYYFNLFFKKYHQSLSFFFQKKNSDLNQQELQEKQLAFQNALDWVEQNVPQTMYSLGEQLFLEIFLIEIQQGIYNENNFQKFLELAPRGYYGIAFNESKRKSHESKKKSYDSFWEGVYGWLNRFWIADGIIVSNFLKEIFRSAKTFKPYDDYLQTDYLNDLFYSTKLLQGQTITDISKYLSPSRITQLTEQKEISFTQNNKNYYKPGEEVEIELDVKNVQKFTVSIYEVNAQTYFREKLAPFQNSITLEGIIPKQQFTVNQQKDFSPIVKRRFKYPIKSVSLKKRGIFIIDVMGNGLTSRAVIRKGALIVLQEYTLAGHRLTLISEDREICVPKGLDGKKKSDAGSLDTQNRQRSTGIWLKGRFIPADNEGVVLVPFSVDRAETLPIVICHEGFADIGNLSLKMEQYDFKVAYILNQQSFLRGTKGKFLVQARLYINGVPTTMNAVSEQEIKVTTFNSEGIPLSFTFPVKFDHKQQAQVEIPVKDLLSRISISVTGKVKNTFSGQPYPVSSSFNQQFNLHKNDQFVNLYLRKTVDSGYQVLLLGKNGEPQVGQVVNLNFNSLYFSRNESKSLSTDKNGAVSLGNLSHCSMVTAQIRNVGDSLPISRTWYLNEAQVHLHLPDEITIVVGETFTLPFQCASLQLQNISFYERLSDDSRNVVTFLNKAIKLEQGQAIQIGPLMEGYYTLDFKRPVRKSIVVKVVRGKHWEKNSAFIFYERENKICQAFTNVTNDISIQQVKLVEASDKQQNIHPTLRVKLHLPQNAGLQQVRDSIRVHVIARQFLPSDLTETVNQLRRNLRAPLVSSAQFGLKKSIYLANKQLGDEICYVLDRKNQTKFIGNTLQKPQILLKRTFVRDTTFDQETLQKDQDFQSGDRSRRDEMAAGGIQQVLYQAHPTSTSSSSIYLGGRGGGGGGGQSGTETMNNFLEYPTFIASNLRLPAAGKGTNKQELDEQCTITLPNFPASAYSSVQVILTNFSSVVGGYFPLKQVAIQQKDLRMQSNLKQGEFYTTGRNSTSVLKGQKTSIPSDAESFIFDTLSQVFASQKELILSAHDYDNQNGGYDFWKFLPEWGTTLSPLDKLAQYNEFACHQFNIFLYFQDRDFFNGVVKPFIANKIQKTFVDFFLLGHDEQILSYGETGQFQTLNAMEQCLLLLALYERKEKLRVQALADLIIKKVKCHRVDTKYFNQLFDTVLLAKQQTIQKNAAMKPPPPPPAASAGPPGFYSMAQSSHDRRSASPMMDLCDDLCAQGQVYEQKGMCLMEDQQEEMCSDLDIQCEQKEMAAPKMALLSMPRSLARMEDNFNDQLAEKKKQFKPGFQNLDKTKQYVERTYYGVTDTTFQDIIPANLFWSDLAEHIANTGSVSNFLSRNFILATSRHAEMICVLAFLDIAFTNSDYQMTNAQGRKLDISATQKNNLLIFLQEVKPGKPQLNTGITIAQRFFDPQDQYYEDQDDPGVKISQQVDQFLVDRVYGCQVVISNGSASTLELQILTEIPDGSMPMRSIDFSKTYIRNLMSFNTVSLEYYFYFPSTGSFNVYPANVSRGQKVLAIAGDSDAFQVLTQKTIKKLESFRDILMNGKQEDILNFIREKNILNRDIFRWQDILWQLKDAKFYKEFIKILKTRGIYNEPAWRYGFLHNDLQVVIQFLNKENHYLRNFFKNQFFSAGSIVHDPHRVFQYHPILSSRSHNFMNQKSQILNVQFKETYKTFLQYLISVPPLKTSSSSFNSSLLLVWSYYLLLQERIEQAIVLFQKIDLKELEATSSKQENFNQHKLQYDYMAAYLDIYSGHPQFTIARQISARYLDYPVLSWRNLFQDIANQLAQYDGVFVSDAEQVADTEINQNAQSADAEQSLSFELDQTDLIVYYQNLSTINVNYYELDLEVLFSRSPFIKQEAQEFAYVQSNHTEILQTSRLPIQQQLQTTIPVDLQQQNLLIQISCENQLLTTTYFSANFQVHLIENYGQVQVTDTQNQPISQVYVQCFSQDNDGNTSFYRDGYTDLRGRFDYALSSASDVDKISQFSILVFSEEHGANILEAGKPNAQGSFE